MKIKVSELTGAALDWAVAKAWQPVYSDGALLAAVLQDGYHPSTEWTQGGPIIERHIFRLEDGDGVEDWPDRWLAEGSGSTQYGQTALIAAMRAYVESKLGEWVEIEIPDELL